MSYTYMSINNPAKPYRLRDLPVFFTDETCMDAIRAVLDEKGNFKSFPGILQDERWESKQNIALHRDVRFEAQFFALKDGSFLMLWLVQPSGWEWVDEDGFGFTGDSVIMLYSVIDRNGEFTKEFELFSIDGERYCHEFDEYMK